MSGVQILIALLVPLVVAFVTRSTTSSAVQGGLATALCVAVGLFAVFGNTITGIDAIAGTIVSVVVAAQASYGMFWKPLGISSWILDNLGNTTG